MYTKKIFFLIYFINIIYIYAYDLNSIQPDIKEYYSYDNITDYLDNNAHIYQYKKSQIWNKDEVLKIEDWRSWGMSFICKNDFCTKIDRNDMKLFVEIPDKNNNIKRYIGRSYDYYSIKLNNIPNYIIDRVYNCTKEEKDNKNFDSCIYYALISFECISNSQCLTNKCVDGYCIFNRENPTEFCTDIYSHSLFHSHSYIHCGKLPGDICKSNKECASVKCSKYGYCENPPDGPSDSDELNDLLSFILVFTFGVEFVIIFDMMKRCIQLTKENKNRNKMK